MAKGKKKDKVTFTVTLDKTALETILQLLKDAAVLELQADEAETAKNGILVP